VVLAGQGLKTQEGYVRHSGCRLQLAALSALFDAHVLKFAGLENVAAFQAFDELGVILAAHNLHARVLAGLLVGSVGNVQGRL
jgi:hypothetical protein